MWHTSTGDSSTTADHSQNTVYVYQDGWHLRRQSLHLVRRGCWPKDLLLLECRVVLSQSGKTAWPFLIKHIWSNSPSVCVVSEHVCVHVCTCVHASKGNWHLPPKPSDLSLVPGIKNMGENQLYKVVLWSIICALWVKYTVISKEQWEFKKKE